MEQQLMKILPYEMTIPNHCNILTLCKILQKNTQEILCVINEVTLAFYNKNNFPDNLYLLRYIREEDDVEIYFKEANSTFIYCFVDIRAIDIYNLKLQKIVKLHIGNDIIYSEINNEEYQELLVIKDY